MFFIQPNQTNIYVSCNPLIHTYISTKIFFYIVLFFFQIIYLKEPKRSGGIRRMDIWLDKINKLTYHPIRTLGTYHFGCTLGTLSCRHDAN